MRLLKEENLDHVRISFGYKSITFADTTVEEVYNLAIKIFSRAKVNATIELKNHNPLKKPSAELTLLMTVREEGSRHRNNGHKGKSKNKTLYGLSDEHAMEIFKDGYYHEKD